MISLKTHNILDYLLGVVVAFTPYFFDFAGITVARNVFQTAGVALIVYSLLTNYRYSLFKMIPVRVHLLLDVVNRGRKNVLQDLHRGATGRGNDDDYGDGFLMRQGYTVAWVGWQFDVPRGALLGIAMLGLLPSALDSLPAQQVFATLLLGILLFFILEKLVLWRHCHTHDCEVHGTGVAAVIVGDSFHNFVDGAVIGAAVISSVSLGVSTALAVAAHEIPQEVGDFAILLHKGYSRSRALLVNVLSGCASALGAVLSFVALDFMPRAIPYVLVISASSFIYVAMSDLIPDLHRGRTDAGSLRQILLIAAGVALIALAATGTVGVWGYIGVVPLFTAFFRFCPAYVPFGISTCPTEKKD